MRQKMHNYDEVSAGIWYANVPLKVSISVRRLLRNRWSTKENLFWHDIISNESLLCVSGCGHSESAKHLIIIALYPVILDRCLFSGSVQFAYFSRGFKPQRSFLKLIWLCCVWVLWNEKNNRLFNNKSKTIMQLLDKVKVSSLWWLKAHNASFPFGHQMWWKQPLVCLGFAYL